MTTHTQGIHHVGLTVLNLLATQTFFEEALGFKVVGGKPDYPAVFVSDGSVMLTLWQVEDPATAVPFDRRHGIGLHHLALRVTDQTVLRALASSLAAREDVSVEFEPEALGASGLQHMMLRIPGNIRLELVAQAT